MNRISITIYSQHDRDRLADLAKTLAAGMRVEIKPERRSPEQNDLMWPLLRDVANQVDWYGQKLTDVDWKDVFTAGLKRARIVPNIDGDGFVQLGLHTSDLGKDDMSNLLELIRAFGAERGVRFFDEDSNSAGAPPGRLDALAAEHAPPPSEPAAGATYSDSSDANLPSGRPDAPAAVSPGKLPAAAGAHNFEEASLLSDDWRHTYFSALTRPGDKKESLITRHELALQMLGGKPNERELMWMRMAFTAVKRRNEGQLIPDHFMERKIALLEMPLPIVETAA